MRWRKATAVIEKVNSKPVHNKYRTWDFWLCRVWLPLGFFIQLTGFFWLPHTHHYKVNVANLFLLPAFISLFDRNWLRTALQPPLIRIILIYLAYMSLIPIVRQNEEPLDCFHRSLYIALYIFAIAQRIDINLRELRRFFLAGAIICSIAILYGLTYDLLYLHRWSDTYRFTGYGTLYNPLRSGHLFGFFCVISAWLAFNLDSLRGRGLSIALVVICLIGTVVTGSRAPLAGVALAGFYLIYFNAPRAQLRISLLIATTALIVVCVLFWEQLTVRGLSLRPQIWAEVIKQWQEYPWLGAGYNAELNINISASEDTFFDTHNIILAVLYYGGIVGVLLFLTLHVTAFFQAFESQKRISEASLAAALMIYGLTALQFDGGSIIGRPNEFWLLLWFPLALLLLVKRIASRQLMR
jgi:O-antigen ligase